MKDWPGSFEMVNPRSVVIDHRYQRPDKPDLIARIAQSPDWRKFGALVCARRENKMLYCYDGQQRLNGVLASETPPKAVPAVVFSVGNPKDEAELFADVNIDRKAVGALEKFKARLFQGHPVYLLINKTVEDCGFSIGSSAHGPRTIPSIGSLERIYNRSGEQGIRLTLEGIRDAWDDDQLATRGKVLDALNIVIAEHNGGIDRGKIANGFKRTTPAKILQRSEQLQYKLGGSKEQNLVRAIGELTKLKGAP